MPATLTLRPAEPGDRDRIAGWLARPDVQRWWGSASAASAEVNLALSSPSALCRIITVAGMPVGYAHAVDAALWGETLPPEIAPGTWDIDLVIAEQAHRGQGHGEAALRALVAEVFATTFALAVSVLVSVRNEAAVRVYEKAGFRWVRVWADPLLGPSWLLMQPRP